MQHEPGRRGREYLASSETEEKDLPFVLRVTNQGLLPFNSSAYRQAGDWNDQLVFAWKQGARQSCAPHGVEAVERDAAEAVEPEDGRQQLQVGGVRQLTPADPPEVDRRRCSTSDRAQPQARQHAR